MTLRELKSWRKYTIELIGVYGKRIETIKAFKKTLIKNLKSIENQIKEQDEIKNQKTSSKRSNPKVRNKRKRGI